MIKKVVITVLICILALPLVVFGESFNIYDENLPLPPVRDQKKYSDCWSYAAIGAVEHSMVMKDRADFSDEKNLFSERHMAAAMNTVEDAFFEKYTRSHKTGGNRESAVAYLARSFASGPVLYEDYNDFMYDMYINDRSKYKLLTLKEKQATMTRAEFLTRKYRGSSYARYDEERNTVIYGKDEEVIDKIKNAVREYGAVAVSYCAYERDQKTYYNPIEAAYCVPWEDYINSKTPDGNCVVFESDTYQFRETSNHVVLIVGWDDDYPYTNFKEMPVSYNGEEYTPENGAWIVKNSWGTDFGKDGFEYISYMDPTICRNATVYDMEYTKKYTAVTHTEKGLMGSVRFPGVGYGVCGVNRFDEKGLINAVGIYVCDEVPVVEIVIDTEPEEALKKYTKAQFEKKRLTLVDPETGRETESLSFESQGYYMLYLKEPIYSKGKFDIYVKYSVDEKRDVILPSGNNMGTDETYVPSVTYWAHITGNGHVHEWKGIDVNWCINVFTVEDAFEKVKSVIEGSSAELRLRRYDKGASCRVMAVFYRGDKIVAKKSYTPEFDEYGYWTVNEKIDGVTDVKAFVWQQNKRVFDTLILLLRHIRSQNIR